MTLLSRSLLVLGLLFGMLFAVGMAALAYFDLPWGWGIGFALGGMLLQYLVGPWILQWIYRIHWAGAEDFSPAVRDYLLQTCKRAGIPVPRLGIIEDGNPNAFTFGHYPGDARLVVTRGLLEMLDEEEQKAVLGHEVGHIVHWDFVVMTLAAMVPVVLYTIYRLLASSEKSGRSRKNGGHAALVGLAAYVAYVISQYIVLLLSRVREYYADEFSGLSTGSPNALARALVKIAYGLARAPKEEEQKQDLVTAQAGKSLGIFDHRVAGNVALAAAGTAASGALSEEAMVGAMKWDLWNPWAGYYEIHSTHPLPAKRIRALEKLSVRLQETPAFDFPETQPESYWDEFAGDVVVHFLPVLGAAVGLAVGAVLAMNGGTPLAAIGLLLTGLGFGSLIKVVRAHPDEFYPRRTVESLVAEVKVSDVRAVPCVVEGKIIGRGVPGLFYSEDLVLQDETGFIILDYRQPLRLLEFLFGAFRAEAFIGQQARAVGWYRRAPHPYIEIKHVEFEGMPAQRCWAYTGQLVLSLVVMALGLILSFIALGL